MKIKATKNFSGLVTMSIGDTGEVADEIAADLIRAGYAEDVTPAPATATKTPLLTTEGNGEAGNDPEGASTDANKGGGDDSAASTAPKQKKGADK